MWSRPSAGAGPVSRTPKTAGTRGCSGPPSNPCVPKVHFSSRGWLTPDLKPAGTEGQLSSVPGAVVANRRSLRGFKQQTRSLTGCTPAVQVLQGSSPGGSRRVCCMLFPCCLLVATGSPEHPLAFRRVAPVPAPVHVRVRIPRVGVSAAGLRPTLSQSDLSLRTASAKTSFQIRGYSEAPGGRAFGEAPPFSVLYF